LGEVMEKVSPDLVLVHGDTSTAFFAALAAFYHKIPVGHVEAGLRTNDMYSPFPEEMNRALVARIAALNFAPTETNRENLLRENAPGKIYVTGNTVIDAMAYTTADDYHYDNPALESLRDMPGMYVLMTAHRRENLGEPLAAICRAALRLVEAVPELHIVYPVHLNPAVRNTVNPILSAHPRIHLTEPIELRDMHNFMARCRFTMTDSGGIQEEATALSVPTLVLRRETERSEGVETGILKLVGVDEEEVFTSALALSCDDALHARMSRARNPYGDGRACEYIADGIAEYFD
jgi:UDP-N-acetylglucosamine 2-epimerase (non-hydrolysing)